MKRSELVFIPSPGIGHVTSTVELALLLVSRDDRFVVTIILMKLPFDEKFTSYCKSLTESTISNNIKFLDLPLLEQALDMKAKDILAFYMETYKPLVKEALAQLIESSTSSPDKPPRLIGLLVDMFCVTMVDVGNDFGLSSYVFFTSGVGYLSLLFSMQTMKDEQNVDSTQFKDSDTELVISSFGKPIPARVLPSMFLNKDVVPGFLELARKYRQTKGIVVNTFLELESHVMSSFFEGLTLPIYPVGPILKLQRDEGEKGSDGAREKEEIKKWLDDQPPSSVVFLCFGSMGSFDEDQLREISKALEHSGHRFFMVPASSSTKGYDYILAHPAVGGFVSHCGWNSILESLWFGVPIATWPIDGEQQLNAFQMVAELGLGVEIKLDYRKDFLSDDEVKMVTAEEIERGINSLMQNNSEIKRKVKEMSEKSKEALMEGGSSHTSFRSFYSESDELVLLLQHHIIGSSLPYI
ncbi:hypothetical protein OIU84_011842 [Salix udensis]|uniref:anthocyanidin 3-O-glucosyltransferase n=1 Tax=Salix udensis TaxID=889485 RepID=A0AAD6JP68_9ROSI|nr:hypothetical protein OIU84_011842 [Salix udensis]